MTTKPAVKTSAKQTRMFDIQKESVRIAAALAKLKAEQKPGEASGMGSKTDVLLQLEAGIKELHEAGYTANQIAKAISNDSFGILPKSITQLLNKHAASRTTQPKRAAKKAESKPSEAKVTATASPAKTTSGKQVTEIGDVE